MGIIGDFLVGAGQTAENIGLTQIKSDIEEQKATRLAELAEQAQGRQDDRRNQYAIESDSRRNDYDIDRENRGIVNSAILRKQNFDFDNDPDNVDTSNETSKSKAEALGDVSREQTRLNVLASSTAPMLDALRKTTAAGESSSVRASAAATSWKLQNDKKAQLYQDDYVAAVDSGDADAIEKAKSKRDAYFSSFAQDKLESVEKNKAFHEIARHLKDVQAQLQVNPDDPVLKDDYKTNLIRYNAIAGELTGTEDIVKNKDTAGIGAFDKTKQPKANPVSKNESSVNITNQNDTSSPKDGDIRSIVAGRGRGYKDQVYTRIGRSNSFSWVDK